MNKTAALKQLSDMALAHAELTGLLKTPRAADFYDILATALKSDCSDDSARAALLAAHLRESDRQQLQFRELLRS